MNYFIYQTNMNEKFLYFCSRLRKQTALTVNYIEKNFIYLARLSASLLNPQSYI